MEEGGTPHHVVKAVPADNEWLQHTATKMASLSPRILYSWMYKFYTGKT